MPRSSQASGYSIGSIGYGTAGHSLPRPNIGEIWWAKCSINEIILETARAHSIAPLTPSMQSELTSLAYCGELKFRPCIIIDIDPHARTATIVAMATFGGTPIRKFDRHTKHFTVAVGRTRPWPASSAYTLQPEPDWPHSLDKPCYAIAYEYDISLSDIGHRYVYKSPDGDVIDANYHIPEEALTDLQLVCATRLEKYEKRPLAEGLRWNKEYTEKLQAKYNFRSMSKTMPVKNLPSIPEGPHRATPPAATATERPQPAPVIAPQPPPVPAPALTDGPPPPTAASPRSSDASLAGSPNKNMNTVPLGPDHKDIHLPTSPASPDPVASVPSNTGSTSPSAPSRRTSSSTRVSADGAPLSPLADAFTPRLPQSVTTAASSADQEDISFSTTTPPALVLSNSSSSSPTAQSRISLDATPLSPSADVFTPRVPPPAVPAHPSTTSAVVATDNISGRSEGDGSIWRVNATRTHQAALNAYNENPTNVTAGYSVLPLLSPPPPRQSFQKHKRTQSAPIHRFSSRSMSLPGVMFNPPPQASQFPAPFTPAPNHPPPPPPPPDLLPVGVQQQQLVGGFLGGGWNVHRPMQTAPQVVATVEILRAGHAAFATQQSHAQQQYHHPAHGLHHAQGLKIDVRAS